MQISRIILSTIHFSCGGGLYCNANRQFSELEFDPILELPSLLHCIRLNTLTINVNRPILCSCFDRKESFELIIISLVRFVLDDV